MDILPPSNVYNINTKTEPKRDIFEMYFKIYTYIYMVEIYTKDLKQSVYHGAIISALDVGYTMLGKTLIKMSPPFFRKFNVQDGVKLVAIIAISDFPKDYLMKQKIIPNNIFMQRAKKTQERLDYINNEIIKEHKAKKGLQI